MLACTEVQNFKQRKNASRLIPVDARARQPKPSTADTAQTSFPSTNLNGMSAHELEELRKLFA